MLDFETDYPRWRCAKLAAWANPASQQWIEIENPAALTPVEYEQLRERCEQVNFAFYRLCDHRQGGKEAIRALLKQLGVSRLDHNLCADKDAVSTLKIMELGRASGYIPYTGRALNWHTDGYYNEPQQRIRSFLLHCVQNAADGGESMLLNHEIVYIRLRDAEPALAEALMQPNAMTIPANVENGQQIRAPQAGPVFYRDAASGCLQMRYTARSRNIEWKADADIQRALALIEQLLSDEQELIIRHTLRPGEGVLCNNILHGRNAFTNGNIPAQERILYRARSYDRLFART